ncbi:MAG: hypothetical protein IIC61_04510 [Proteobacteria bacterium]|nr:hypothetical protein [Pseudomonadota bacterium]TDJ32840.1 MAG: hypothetical protein E2O53_11270 [Gammaproteobacteria bacterium]
MKIKNYFLAACVCAGCAWSLMGDYALADPGCANSAHTQRLACEFDLRDDFFTSSAQCFDSANQDPVCFSDAEADFDDGLEECGDVLEARLDLCELLDDATHDPEFGPDFAANFVNPLEIGNTITPNPWFALVPGNLWVYEGDGETIEVEVTGDTKLIDGITCIVVIDTASEDDVVIEKTDDWYAQDVDGNVWYCGEISENFEEFDGDETSGPELVDIDGSWKAGRDGAEAGMLLPFNPQVGDVFRQEFAQTDAEDAIEILAIDATEAAPGGACAGNCLMTRDFTPLEPDVEENKFYAPGIGLIVELDPATGDRVELVSFTGVGQ